MQDQNSSTKPLPSEEHCALADGFASPDNVVDIKPTSPWAWCKWACDYTLPGLRSREKLVLMALARRANKPDGKGVFPSQDLLCQNTCLDRRTIVRAINGLVDKGLIERHRRNDRRGLRRGNEYTLIYSQSVPLPPKEEKDADHAQRSIPLLVSVASDAGFTVEKKSPCVTLAHQSCVTLAHQSANIGVTLAHQDVSHWRIEENTIGVPPLRGTKEEVSIQRRREDVVDEEGGQHPIIPPSDEGISSPTRSEGKEVDTKELANEKKSPERESLHKDAPPRTQESYQSKSINSVGRRYVPLPTKQRRGPPPAARGPTDPDTIARHAESKRRMALVVNASKEGGDEAMRRALAELAKEDEARDRLDGSMDCSPPLAALNGPLRGEANG